MDKATNQERIKDIDNGFILKSADVQNQDVTDEELRKINKFTLTPLTKDDVFVFKTIMGDNETDDRNFEPFNLNALKDLKRLYIGKTVIKDHSRSSNNQIARIYDTELVTEAKLTGAGEPYTKLIGKCYMVKTESNADLIKEIQAGIKKEVSTGCRPKKLLCNICGTDNMKDWCSHFWGREYEKEGKKTVCMMTIDGAKEAYELSFVAVPAQPRAGVSKSKRLSYLKEENEEETEDDTTFSEDDETTDETTDEEGKAEENTDEEEEETTENEDEEKAIQERLRLGEAFLFCQKSLEIMEELENE